MEATLTIAVVLANVIGSVMAFPQLVRLARTRQSAGVSAAWAGISVGVNMWWMLYGLGAGVAAVLPVSIVSCVAYLAIIVILISLDPGVARGAATGFGVIAVVPLPFLAMSGWPAVGLVVGLMYGVQLAPAVFGAYRTAEPVGISPGTWTLAILEASLWGFYGVAEGDVALIAAGLVGVAMAAAILLRLARVRRGVMHPIPA